MIYFMMEDDEFGMELYRLCFVGEKLINGVVALTAKWCGNFVVMVEPVFADILDGCHSFSDMLVNYIIKFSLF